MSGSAPAEGSEKKTSNAVEVYSLPVPISRDDRLTNYIILSFKAVIAPGKDSMKIRDRAQFFRDDLLRACHRYDLSDPKDTNKFNMPALMHLIAECANRTLGPGAISRIDVTAADSSAKVLRDEPE